MSNILQLEDLQTSVNALCDRISKLTHENQSLKNELQGSENVRRLLVRKNQHLADQVKQIIKELKETHR